MEANASRGSSTDKSTSRGSSTDRSTSRGRGVSMEASTSSSDEEEEHEGRQAAWVNLRTNMANQLEQNMEVHVQGALLRRVKEYLMSVHYLTELDCVNWGHSKQLFDTVDHGTVERHAGSMSQQLKTCLQDLRTTLQPSADFTGPLPRRIIRPFRDLLALNLFLTRHLPDNFHAPCATP
ncbi:hypothetical protein DUNSADRAFT_9145 [Dunaliella salina]|uniref:Uncharacterized protein n=1 Tax=Dunaliella salina TaxID=3046 RepID=A0ABQ7GIA4_DUNSA|nr:hypothetical protein DUNSADRAFT_9145 [Dunaliella salina]|eukprot:KAF5834278.1 hypothetical protein DUNSADRAFT_9145 [Dunaliella salina]